MIKAIIFDCFGVLTADKWHEFRTQLPHEQQAGASDLNQQYCRGEISRQQFLEAVAKLTGQKLGVIAQLIDNETGKNTQLLHYIALLKPTYKIGLLSNIASNWICDYFLSPQEQALFDAMIFSYKVGVTKPAPKIYQIAARRLKVATNQCIFVDDIEPYAQAATAEAMHGVTYQNFQQMHHDIEEILARNTQT